MLTKKLICSTIFLNLSNSTLSRRPYNLLHRNVKIELINWSYHFGFGRLIREIFFTVNEKNGNNDY